MIEDYIDYYNNQTLAKKSWSFNSKWKNMKFTRKPHKKLPADNLLAGKILYFSIVYLTGSSSKIVQPFFSLLCGAAAIND